jgi:drug/metabolite transporter (DMT)-like permease
MNRASSTLPLLAVVVGIGAFSAMDAAIKGASLAVGVYSALLLRNLAGTALCLPLWWAKGGRMPRRPAMAVHVQRSAIVAAMAALFFYGLVRIPMAEGIAISFIAPVIALWFAAIMLGERVRPRAVAASLIGLAGVCVIALGRLGEQQMEEEAALGLAAILLSAMLYAVNLVLQRKQAMLAGPVEIALFQNLFMGLIYLVFAPWLLRWPNGQTAALILAGAVLATAALLFLAWGYARAETQVLVPVEYTGFLWAALLGHLFFGEAVSAPTLAGAVLIVAGCFVAARTRSVPTEQTSL